jgi:hypothetical protein
MGCYSIPQIQNMLRQAGWQENMIAKMSAIVMYESGGCDSASNRVGETSIGLLQINIGVHGTKYGTETQLRNPVFNLQQALRLYNVQGINAWYNSNKKYNSNYQGIAAKAQSIYKQGGSDTVILNSNNVMPLLNNTNTPNTNKDYTAYYILGALGLVLALRL